jgi:hypothetical protein
MLRCSSAVHLRAAMRSLGGARHRVLGSVRSYHRVANRCLRRVEVVTKFLARIVAWINSGYPEGVPGPDRVPLLALLRRRLTDDEVKAVVTALLDDAGSVNGIDKVDIGVLITQITDDLPSPDDIERVRERLAAKGWPLDDPRDAEDRE